LSIASAAASSLVTGDLRSFEHLIKADMQADAGCKSVEKPSVNKASMVQLQPVRRISWMAAERSIVPIPNDSSTFQVHLILRERPHPRFGRGRF